MLASVDGSGTISGTAGVILEGVGFWGELTVIFPFEGVRLFPKEAPVYSKNLEPEQWESHFRWALSVADLFPVVTYQVVLEGSKNGVLRNRDTNIQALQPPQPIR